jgi:hypothetical protein
MATLEALEERLSTLSQRVEELEARLDGEAGRRAGLMRDTRRCPACRGQRILHVEWFQNAVSPEDTIKTPISVALETTFLKAKFLGVLQAFVCAGCGHAEIQLEDASGLEGKKNVRVLDPPAGEEGPYR